MQSSFNRGCDEERVTIIICRPRLIEIISLYFLLDGVPIPQTVRTFFPQAMTFAFGRAIQPE
jgi:hypothetical protein